MKPAIKLNRKLKNKAVTKQVGQTKETCPRPPIIDPDAIPGQSKEQMKNAATHRIPPHPVPEGEKKIPQSWESKNSVMESPRRHSCLVDIQIWANSLGPPVLTNTTINPTKGQH